MNIHKPEIRLELVLKKLDADSTIADVNKKLIHEFIDYIQSIEQLSHTRALKYVYCLKVILPMLDNDFDKITKENVIHFLKHCNTSTDKEEWTKHGYLTAAKKFYTWMQKEKTIREKTVKAAVKQLAELRIKRAKSREKTPEHILSTEEVLKIADKTKNSRDRAFVLAFYESCCRIGEILPVKIKDCQFDQYGCKIYVTGKTGVRPIRLIASQPAISNWLTNHPDKENPEAFLFCGIGRTNLKQMLSYTSARQAVFEAADKAGIKKRVNLHKFRASRATELSKTLSDTVICKIGGWVPGSQELQQYLYLSGKDTDDAILEINGLIKKKDSGNGFTMVVCPRCNTPNSPGSKFCANCSLGMDTKTMMTFEQTKEDVMGDIVDLFKDKEDALKTLEKIAKIIRNK